ncbi:T9SS type B sorting domain-containing protein [Tenacibaculum agarivorans]|uniref:T9SS type B sorting domain-containing protein n=1 Tax=Tenacibaculum agarivorans TaxID=1908389 RepID=UPI00094B9FF4|nr:T9SS type B sorting domain-containing protein [Tenacibaculum agarivorans]
MKIILQKKLLLLLFLLLVLKLQAQNDCVDAIPVCGNSGYQDLSVLGTGIQELTGSNTCSSQENNSIWFKLQIKNGGTLGFTLKPTNLSINEDFDFFIFGPNATCGNIGTAIRCSTTNPASAGQSNNLTGMNDTELDTYEGPGPDGNSFVKSLNVNAGDSYFLVIDRPIGNSNFNLIWTGTATFDEPPTVDTSILTNNTLNINECDTDGDGVATFNLNINDAVIGTQSNIIASYHTSSNDAILNINPINNTTNYKNISNPQFVFLRLTNTLTDCFEVRDFKLSISPIPNLPTPTPYEVCDDNASGSDIDGISSNFILSTKDAEILNSLSPLQYRVSYHSTLTGAQTNSASDIINKNLPYRNTTPLEEKIYITVESINNPKCFIFSDDTSTSSTFKPLRLIVNPLPVIANNPVEIEQCDSDGDLRSIINLTQAQISISNNHFNESFKYYPSETDAIAGTMEITNPIQHIANNGDSVWVRTISNKGCYRISRLNITIAFASDVSYNQTFTSCDDFLDATGNNTIDNNDRDGISNFDLSPAIDAIKLLFNTSVRKNLEILLFESSEDRDAVIHPIPDTNKYRNTNIPALTPQPIFVKIINKINNNCTGLGTFNIHVLPLPEFNILTPQTLCLNSPSISLEIENPDDLYQYEWIKNGNSSSLGNNEQLQITEGGEYIVTATNTITNCKRSKTVIVNESIIATITPSDITIIDDSDNNTININNTNNNLGIGDYEFALQDENAQIIIDFQDAPIFENLEGGIYTILVRDKNNCGTAKLDVSVLEFPKYFTPNNDGVNDTWTIKGVSSVFYPNSTITIFDRFGKIMTSLGIDDQGWNGLFNGKLSSPTDYWFNIELIDRNGNKINRRGHFSLLRQ